MTMVRFTVTVPETTRAGLDRIAARVGLSRADVVRIALAGHVDKFAPILEETPHA